MNQRLERLAAGGLVTELPIWDVNMTEARFCGVDKRLPTSQYRRPRDRNNHNNIWLGQQPLLAQSTIPPAATLTASLPYRPAVSFPEQRFQCPNDVEHFEGTTADVDVLWKRGPAEKLQQCCIVAVDLHALDAKNWHAPDGYVASPRTADNQASDRALLMMTGWWCSVRKRKLVKGHDDGMRGQRGIFPEPRNVENARRSSTMPKEAPKPLSC
ncbi:hypothetical protein QBC40DRAFT_349360 [Triangularia verruculosa]|uniref:Uncharacterized protein n=1 Tax=Triangularia verruculosa TaxID=2587418 RepID=A0AAN7AUI3_9PEZI|nr:hypothetical protein QBC40DRAFT_349360 [Triangularia verruculosa]